MQKSILLVEDDPEIQQFLKELLLDNGYIVYAVSDGAKAVDHFKKTTPDIIVLDLGLPIMTGEEVVAAIRKNHQDVPIIILSARDSTDSILEGFNLGADDYVPKPFVADELLARIKARIKKLDDSEKILTVGDLELNSKTLEVRRAGNYIQLTPQEFKLLEYLMNNKGKILTRDMILSKIWLYSSDVETRVVDVYMGYLRKKVDSSFSQKLLFSVRGFGYIIKEPF